MAGPILIALVLLASARGEASRADATRLGTDPTGNRAANGVLLRAFSGPRAVDTLFLPRGRFLLHSFRMPPGKALIGSGSATLIVPSSRAAAGPGPFVEVPGPAVLEGFSVHGGGRTIHPWVRIGAGARSVRLADLRFERCGGVVVLADHAGRGRPDTSEPAVRVLRCRFTRPTTAIEIDFSEGILCSANVIRDPDRSGILYWGVTADLRKRQGRLETAERCRALAFVDNVVEDSRPVRIGRNAKEGIWGSGGVGILIAGNRVEVAEDVGIDVEWSEDVTIRDNWIRGARNGGIACFYSSRNVLIEGNTILNDYPDEDRYPEGLPKGDRASILLSKSVPNIPPCDTAYRCGHRDIRILGNRLVHKADRERRSIHYQLRDDPRCASCPLIHEGRGILIAGNALKVDTAGAPDRSAPLFRGDWRIEGDSLLPLDAASRRLPPSR